MTSFDTKLVAGDEFRFSSNSLTGVESGEDCGLAFGEWNGWHCDTYGTSECHCEPEWLARDDVKSKVDHPSYFEGLSPTSRVQEMAKYKQEMVELVQEAPEYAYELSLRDLVELPRIARTARESPVRERMQKHKVRTGGEVKVKKIGRRPSRSESMEGAGFLLKMFFPIHSPGKKRNSISSDCSLTPTSRSSSSGSSTSSSSSSSTGATKSGSGSRVSPKPSKDGRRSPSAVKNSKVKSVEMQHGAVSRNLSRYDEELSKYFREVSEHISPLLYFSSFPGTRLAVIPSSSTKTKAKPGILDAEKDPCCNLFDRALEISNNAIMMMPQNRHRNL